MPAFEDLSGKKIGYLTILSRAEDHIQPSGQHKRMWHCICECGKECDVRASDLKSGNTTSCGCQSSKKRSIGLEDLVGKQFGDFVVLSRSPNKVTPSGQQTRQWHCKCLKCGMERDIAGSQIKQFSGKCICSIQNEREHRRKIEQTRIFERKNKEELIQQKRIKDEEVLSDKMNQFIGEKFGLLTVIDFYKEVSGKYYWKCRCDCGNDDLAILESALLKGKRTSCGCIPQRRSGVSLAEDKELLKEWHPTKNGSLMPDMIGTGTSKKVWWLCPNGHPYEAAYSVRVRSKSGCPYCCNPPKKIWVGFNDLATTCPELVKDWHPTLNGKLNPTDVFRKSTKEVWWKPECGHEFKMRILAKKPGSCPYCSHQKILQGYSDFATTNPELLEEWDYEKNTVLPTEIGVGSHEKIWWKCPFGHSYQSFPSNRCGKNRSSCPICDKENHTSFPEQAILFYIQQKFDGAINSDRYQIGMELDIYIPERRIAIEYDGKTWHQNNSYEVKKNQVCLDKKVMLIRVRENGLQAYDECICLFREDNRSDESLSKVIIELLHTIGINDVDVDVERDAAKIYSGYIKTRKQKSLANMFPDIAAEWHPNRNGELTPEMVAPVANKKVWWLGQCGHEYQMEIDNRTNQGCGCPYCTGKRVLKGFNDLETWCIVNNSKLMDEWDFERNAILPSEVTKASDKIVFWKCGKCHNVWKMKIDSRTRMNSGCPKCASYFRNAKKVINLDTGVIYESMIAAGQALSINSACIGNVCRGKQKTAGGYRWMFYE